jgi:hypothetical protein
MPFDTTKLRQPTVTVPGRVTVLPPTPPERSDGPRRVHIQIEIVDRRTPPRRRRSSIGVWWWLLLFLLLALAAHAQPTQWQSYREGFVTRYQGTDAQGGTWTGQSYKQGFTTYSDFYGPHGETQHCQSYKLGGQTITSCDPQ